MRRDGRSVLVVELIALVLGLAVWCGRWWRETELRALMDAPPGMAVMDSSTGTLWWKNPDDYQALHWKHVPDPHQALMVYLFPPAVAPETTSTTLPATDNKRSKP